MDEAKTAWAELEAATEGNITAEAALTYLADNAEGWVATFARMVTMVIITDAQE